MKTKKLKTILAKHVAWINGDGGVRADLHGANLRSADLCSANLCGANLCGTDLRGASLCDADMRDASLCNADLRSAYLHGTNLCGADLHGANLRSANIDFSCLPLWCGSFGMKVDRRIAVQILYHFCRLDIDDREMTELQKTLAPLANECHRTEECGIITAE